MRHLEISTNSGFVPPSAGIRSAKVENLARVAGGFICSAVYALAKPAMQVGSFLLTLIGVVLGEIDGPG